MMIIKVGVVLLALALVLNVTGLAVPYWLDISYEISAQNSTMQENIRFGLWQECLASEPCRSLGTAVGVNGTVTVVSAVRIMLLISNVLDVLNLVIAGYGIHTSNLNGVLQKTVIGFAAVAGLMAVIGPVTFIAAGKTRDTFNQMIESKGNAVHGSIDVEYRPHAGFVLCVLAGSLLLTAAIVFWFLTNADEQGVSKHGDEIPDYNDHYLIDRKIPNNSRGSISSNASRVRVLSVDPVDVSIDRRKSIAPNKSSPTMMPLDDYNFRRRGNDTDSRFGIHDGRPNRNARQNGGGWIAGGSPTNDTMLINDRPRRSKPGNEGSPGNNRGPRGFIPAQAIGNRDSASYLNDGPNPMRAEIGDEPNADRRRSSNGLIYKTSFNTSSLTPGTNVASRPIYESHNGALNRSQAAISDRTRSHKMPSYETLVDTRSSSSSTNSDVRQIHVGPKDMTVNSGDPYAGLDNVHARSSDKRPVSYGTKSNMYHYESDLPKKNPSLMIMRTGTEQDGRQHSGGYENRRDSSEGHTTLLTDTGSNAVNYDERNDMNSINKGTGRLNGSNKVAPRGQYRVTLDD